MIIDFCSFLELLVLGKEGTSMISKNDLGRWGVVVPDGLPFDVFCVMCQITGYLNQTTLQKPTKKDLAVVPDELLVEVADLIQSW